MRKEGNVCNKVSFSYARVTVSVNRALPFPASTRHNQVLTSVKIFRSKKKERKKGEKESEKKNIRRLSYGPIYITFLRFFFI